MNKIIILPALSVLIVSLVIPIESANTQAPPPFVAESKLLKFVVSFTSTKSEVAVIALATNQLFPDMRGNLNANLNANFIDSTVVEDLRIINHGNDRWEVYPKVVVSGNGKTGLTEAQQNVNFDLTIDDWISLVEQRLIAFQATDVVFHLHKSTGSLDVRPSLPVTLGET